MILCLILMRKYVYDCYLSYMLLSPLKNRVPKSFTIANFRHPLSKSWLRPCLHFFPQFYFLMPRDVFHEYTCLLLLHAKPFYWNKWKKRNSPEISLNLEVVVSFSKKKLPRNIFKPRSSGIFQQKETPQKYL